MSEIKAPASTFIVLFFLFNEINLLNFLSEITAVSSSELIDLLS